ncbi:MAG: methyl-accepting chemotaxis protein [Pseudomonadota bacterium]
MSQPFLRRVSGSIATKLSLILIAMAGTTGVAIAIGLVMFNTLAGSIHSLTGSVVPNISASLGVIRSSAAAGDRLAEFGLAPDLETLTAHGEVLEAAITTIEQDAQALDPEVSATLLEKLNALRGATSNMQAAMAESFQASATLAERVATLQTIEEDASGLLTERSDDALFELTIGGETTISGVRETLSTLTDTEFALVQNVLQLQSDINLATGAVLALMQTRDVALAAIIRDLATSGVDRVEQALASLSEEARLADDIDPIAALGTTLQDLRAQNFPVRAGVAEQLLSARQGANAAVSGLLDDLSFTLAILAIETADENEAAIRSMLDTEVARLTSAFGVEAAVKSLFVEALLGVTSDTVAAVNGAQTVLDEAARQLTDAAQGADIGPDLQSLLDRLLAISASDGILAARLSFLEAREKVATASARARTELSRIAVSAQSDGMAAMDQMVRAGGDVLAQATRAEGQMRSIGIASVGVLVVAALVTWLLILRPMARVTRVTERLATGNLDPVTGFERTGGEVGRMASALGVFRDGMIEQQRLEQEQREQEAARLEAERAAEDEKRRAEAARLEEERKRADEELERERREEERKREVERAAQAERDNQAAEQASIVETIGDGLGRLAQGDLTTSLSQQFPETYEPLRRDFNATVQTLADIVRALSTSANSVDASSGEIAGSATQLAQRTEKNAAALEETAAAVTELDASARSTSETADMANKLMVEARGQAEDSKSTVEAAMATMSKVEESSGAISKIIDLIEEVAFQTNLLALNAGVEAARAGEHGRGFAVVATEVRGLAQRASDAAGEINTLITATREQIGAGVKEVGEAGRALNGIIEFIEAMSEQISTISSSATEQATTVTEISSAVSSLDTATQRNAAMFEEALAASQTLNLEAGRLSELVKRFRVGDGAEQRSDHARTHSRQPKAKRPVSQIEAA